LESDQVTIRILNEKLNHADLGVSRPIPLGFRLHEEVLPGRSKGSDERLNRRDGDLKVDRIPR
jgi:hypothetical protein